MTKIIRNLKHKYARKERGQVLVVVALAAVGIIAIVGLVMDVGLMFIGNARLRRAVDSAALAAALQYRQGYSTAKLEAAADEFLMENGIPNPVSVVNDCDNTPGDLILCPQAGAAARKLVRVTTTAQVKLAFLPIIGINSVTVNATAISEAASLDVVLVIDTSESMTYGPDLNNPIPTTDPMRDPFYCNGIPATDGSGDAGSCQPFDKVINAAVAFTQSLFFPYDQVAIITFDKEPKRVLGLDQDCATPGCSADEAKQHVIDTLKNLTVYQGDETVSGGSANAIYPNGSPSRCYGAWACEPDVCAGPPSWSPSSNYQTLVGPAMDPCDPPNANYVDPPDYSHYTTTNTGGGLLLGGNEFAYDNRQDTLWVVILLTDGVANAGHNKDGTVYFCPQDTWGLNPPCNDGDASTRNPVTISGNPNPDYDASDYAYDMADFVGKKYPNGQGALIYTIGLGPLVNSDPQPSFFDPNNLDKINYPTSRNEGIGRIFLNYAAAIGNGQPFYAAQPADLDKIFLLIGSNIAIRLSQ